MVKGKKGRFASWVVLAVLVFALGAPLLWAGYLVSDKEKVCYQVSSNPGIGLGVFYYSEECPSGYAVKSLPEPETSWWVKLLNMLDKLFGLSNKYVWVFSISKLATIAAIVLFIKRLLGLVGATIGGKWTWLLSAVVGFLTYIEPLLSDGKLSVYELLLSVFYVVFGSSLVWKTAKAAVGKEKLTTELKGAFTGK